MLKCRRPEESAMSKLAVPASYVWPLVQVHKEESDGYSAQVVGLAEVRATAATRDEALAQVRALLLERFASEQLVPLAIPLRLPSMKPAGWAAKDALEQEFLEELARARQQDLENALREFERDDEGCSNTSSTPTT
jgi:predicted RNase H-like HicB family nuclease